MGTSRVVTVLVLVLAVQVVLSANEERHRVKRAEDCPHPRFVRYHVCVDCDTPDVNARMDNLLRKVDFVEWMRAGMSNRRNDKYTFYIPRNAVEFQKSNSYGEIICQYKSPVRRFDCYKRYGLWRCHSAGYDYGMHSGRNGHLFQNNAV